MKEIIISVLLVSLGHAYATEPSGGYVGRDACYECHEEEMDLFDEQFHGRAIKKMSAEMADRACEICHGPGQEHYDDPTLENIFGYGDDKAANSVGCTECHAEKNSTLKLSNTDHANADVACMDCHSSGHKPALESPLLARTGTDLCAECHTEKPAQFELPYAHRDGHEPMACYECHNPHESDLSAGLFLSKSSRQCVQCHTEKAGPYVFVHPPNQVDACESCHASHGSTNPFQLNRPSTMQLCLECHADTPSFHDISRPKYQFCTSCHSAVHGSHRDPMLFEE